MEIAIKGVLGALVAILLHIAATSKHHYLSGLIPLFPTFALFAHTMFASSGRLADMQVSAQFGMLSLVPYGVYLLLAWWLAFRLNVWLALTVATIGWAAAATAIVVLWNKGGDLIAAIFSSPLSIVVTITTYICTWFATRHYRHEAPSHTDSEQTAAAASRTSSRNRMGRWLIVTGSVVSIALTVGAVYLLRSKHMEGGARTEVVASADAAKATTANDAERAAVPESQEDAGDAVTFSDAGPGDDVDVLYRHADAEVVAQRLTLPPGGGEREEFKAVLGLDPDNTAARQGLQCILTSYVSLAKRADAAGKPRLAATYLDRARSVLFGFRVHTADAETTTCK